MTTCDTKTKLRSSYQPLTRRLREATALEGDSFEKCLALFVLLSNGVNPYSNRFQNYWSKSPSSVFCDGIKVAKTRRGYVSFVDAWKLLTAYSYATNTPVKWKDDIPALVTHWLNDESDVSKMIDVKTASLWHCILADFARSIDGVYSISYPRNLFPLRFKKEAKFTFIDLFAGIGGFRIPLQELGGRATFSSEWDEKSRETYFMNYGEWPFGDISKFTASSTSSKMPNYIPKHEILAAGFPCQPFSQAGQKLGFDDTRGTLFFDILQIAKYRKPDVLFLENVKGLKGHDKGNTFRVICDSLYEIGYKVYTKVISARDFGLPQNRHRVFMVAFKNPIQFRFPTSVGRSKRTLLYDLLEKNPADRFTITDRMWVGHVERKKRHVSNGNGFGYSLFKRDAEYVNTISARYWKDGSEILIDQPSKLNPRTLTPRECARLQGFPEEFVLHHSMKSSYKQFGNAVAVPVVREIAREILDALAANRQAIGSFDPLQLIHF